LTEAIAEMTVEGSLWGDILARIENAGEETAKELEHCFQVLHSLVEARLNKEIDPPSYTADQVTLQAILNRRRELRSYFLESPWKDLGRNRTFKKCSLILENFDRSFEEFSRELPQERVLTGADVLEFLGPRAPKGRVSRRLQRQKISTKWPLRAILRQEFMRQAVKRATIEDGIFYSVAHSMRLLGQSWETVSSLNHQELYSKQALDANALAREQLLKKLDTLRDMNRHALKEWREWSATLPSHLSEAIARYEKSVKDETLKLRRQKHQEHWSIELRAVEEELRVHRTLEESWDAGHHNLVEGLGQIEFELVSILGELDDVVTWLNQRQESPESSTPFPLARTQVVPGANRVDALQASFMQSLRLCPAAVNCLSQVQVHPSSKKEWREVKPREVGREAFVSCGYTGFKEICEQLEAEHRKIIQEIEHTRDVINFGLSAEPEEGFDEQVAEEALTNSLSLMEYYQGDEADWRATIEPKIAKLYVQIFEDIHVRLYQGRVGLLRYLARQGFTRGLNSSLKISSQKTRALGKAVAVQLRDISHDFLVSIGWTRQEPDGRACVTVRDYLPVEFAGEARRKTLPAIYQRLFKLHPIEDPRFLVGRKTELEALWDARRLWESGRPVSVLVTGQRGSGKTSLINCAELSVFKDVEVVRGEFNARITDPNELDDFLLSLLDLPEGTDISQALRERPRVLILEEIERLYLRQVGRYRAIRHLQNLIASTSDRCLWLVAMNEVSCRLLDRATGLKQRITHEISSVVVGKKEIEEAIMIRHGLSGFRLHFAPLINTAKTKKRFFVKPAPRAEELKAAFFAELASRSNGIFRTAIELWLGHIDTFESGALYLKPLRQVSLDGIIAGLDADDLFTLVAILQHGSLTESEHTDIFGCSSESSRTSLDELLGREILESDPKYQGLRIRPEALPLVKEALYRRNLL
jgi:hypothetical protein